MGRASTRTPMNHRVLSPNYNHNTENQQHDQPVVQLSSSIFEFLEEVVMLSSENIQYNTEDENEGESETPEIIEDKIKYWENQRETLHATLFRTTNLEAKIRNITKEVLDELEIAENVCSCLRPVSGGCRNCKMSGICNRLRISGYNSAICKSKWKSSLDIPSGEHTFVDVINDDSNRKKGEIKVIIELEFLGQFEMKKGSEEYNSLVYKLPNVFVGKFDRLQNVIKILSNSAKNSMTEKKMHLGPWRKQGYMQAKWLNVKDRTTITTTTLIKPLVVDGYSSRTTKTGASMLTIDLLDGLPNMSYLCSHAVKVL